MERLYEFDVFKKDEPACKCRITVSALNLGEAVEYIKTATPWDIVDPFGVWRDVPRRKRMTRREK